MGSTLEGEILSAQTSVYGALLQKIAPGGNVIFQDFGCAVNMTKFAFPLGAIFCKSAP